MVMVAGSFFLSPYLEKLKSGNMLVCKTSKFHWSLKSKGPGLSPEAGFKSPCDICASA